MGGNVPYTSYLSQKELLANLCHCQHNAYINPNGLLYFDAMRGVKNTPLEKNPG
jgi:hypothetical protein